VRGGMGGDNREATGGGRRRPAGRGSGPEAAGEFVGSDGGGADLADDHAGGVVGEDGGLERGGAGGDGEGEGGDDGVPGAGDVEDLLGDGGDVKRLLAGAAEEHAQFAERDEEQGGGEVLEETARGADEVEVAERVGVAGFVGQSAELEGLLAVGRDEGEAGEVEVMDGLGVEAQPDAVTAAERLEGVEEGLGDDALAVVADDDGVGAGEAGLEGGEQAGVGALVEVAAGFAVDADDLLLVCDDAGLDAGVAGGQGDEAGAVDLPAQSTCWLVRSRRSWLAAGSRPTTPNSSVRAPRAERLRATLAAPPGMKLSRSKSTTGTGASGEMRATRPQMNWSSMTSPITSTRVRVIWSSSSRSRDGVMEVMSWIS